MRSPVLTVILTLLATVLGAPEPTYAQDTGTLVVEKAKLRWKAHKRTGAARDAFVLDATFPDQEALRAFDPSTDTVTVTVGGLTVIAADAPQFAKAYRLKHKRGALRSWSMRIRGDAGDVGKRALTVVVARGRIRVVVKRAFLRHESLADADDVPIAVTIGDVTAATIISFDRRSESDWRYRRLPSGGGGPRGPVTWDLLATGSLPNATRPNIEVARTAEEVTALWSSYGASGLPPTIDFDQDMVVSVSARIRGPGQFPPVVQISGVTGTTNALRIDWYLAGCDWNLCPGAPAPVTCPTATPFRILRVTKAPAVQAVQGATLGVCP